jgi:hypothetical protein
MRNQPASRSLFLVALWWSCSANAQAWSRLADFGSRHQLGVVTDDVRGRCFLFGGNSGFNGKAP